MFLVLFLGVTSGWPAVSSVQFVWMPSSVHCETALAAIEPLQRALAAVCISPNGEVLGWE